MISAQDHKRVGDGDTGPNTGGMGAYSPAPVATPEIEARIMAEIVRPAIAGLKAEGREFKGVLFAGIMVTRDGPKLIEYNARFGDPECEVLCIRMMSDIVPALVACADGTLEDFDLRWYPDSALTVVMAAQRLSRLDQARQRHPQHPAGRGRRDRVPLRHQAEARARSKPMAGACWR